MDEKRKSKRKSMDDGYWDCSVCTYKNTPEAFKCEMCDVRKGTSTRKPRLNPQLVAQQVAQQFPVVPKKERTPHRESRDRDGDLDMRDSGSYNDSSSTEVSPTVSRDRMDLDEESDSVSSPPKEIPLKETKLVEPLVTKETKEVRDTTSSSSSSTKDVHVKETKPKVEKTTPASTSHTPRISRRPTKLTQLKNIDRSTARSMEVTVGDVTVVITDYKPKKDKNEKNSSICSTDQGNSPVTAAVSSSPTVTNNHAQSATEITNS